MKSCQKDNGGFSGNVAHDPHLLYTLSAVGSKNFKKQRFSLHLFACNDCSSLMICHRSLVICLQIQVLTLFDALDAIDTSRVVAYVKSLQREDGAFCGDEWGEVIFCSTCSPSVILLFFSCLSSYTEHQTCRGVQSNLIQGGYPLLLLCNKLPIASQRTRFY